jgi:hypothetical protein
MAKPIEGSSAMMTREAQMNEPEVIKSGSTEMVAERRVDEWRAVKNILENGTLDGFSTKEMTDWRSSPVVATDSN